MSEFEAAANSHGWFAAVIPAGARRFRVRDGSLAAMLTAAGADVVEDAPDVEIAAAEDLRGDAPYAVVPFAPRLPEGNLRLLRIAKRLGAFAQAQLGVLRARRVLRRRGYPVTAVVRWDIEQVLRRTDVRVPRARLRPVERLPGAAVVIGSRLPRVRTVLEDAAATAATSVGAPPFEADRPMVRGSGVLVTTSDRLVLKVAVGPGRREIVSHCAALELLASADLPAFVIERAPRLFGHGEAGFTYWSVESRLDGREPRALDDSLRADCLEFLVALHGSGGGDARERPLAELAAIVARVCVAADADRLTAVAEEFERELAGLPRGYGHGDFWRGNLLAAGGRVTGVVDWAAAGPGRLPLLDLLNVLTAEREPRYFGRALVEYLLPWARGGGDDLSRVYCERLGLDVGSQRLEALAFAYWLDRAARELETYADRARRPVWLYENVERVTRALASGRRPAAVPR